MSVTFGSSGGAGRVNHGSASSLDDLHTGQFSGWITCMRTSNGNNQFLMVKDSSGTAGWSLLVSNSGGEGQIALSIQRGTVDGIFITSAGYLPLNIGTFIGFTYDPSATPQVRFYVGNRIALCLEATLVTSTAGTGTTPTDASASLLIGNYTSFNLPFLGNISRYGLIDNRILNVYEFQRIQAQNAIADCGVSGDVLLMDLLTTASTTDQSGAGNDGTHTSTSNATHHILNTLYDPTTPTLYFSPYNWYSNGGGSLQANNIKGSSTYARTNNTGAYCKFRVDVATGPSGVVVMEFDVTSYSGITAALVGAIGISLNGGDWGRVQLVYNTDNAMVVQLAASLATGTHTIEVVFFAIGHASSSDRWTGPDNAIKVRGVWIDPTVTLASNTMVKSGNVLGFGASTAEGYAARAAGTLVTSHDPTLAAFRWIANALDCELGNVAFSGSGFTKGIGNVTASSSNPSFAHTTAANEWWDKFSSGLSRLNGGLFDPQPDRILIQLGYNDASLTDQQVCDALEKVQGAAPGVTIYVIDHQLTNISQLAGGIALMADSSRVLLISPETILAGGAATEYSYDALHANHRGHARLAADILVDTEGGTLRVQETDGLTAPIGRAYIPAPPPTISATPGMSTLTTDASGEVAAIICRAPEAGNVVAVWQSFNVGTGANRDIGLYQVDLSTGMPHTPPTVLNSGSFATKAITTGDTNDFISSGSFSTPCPVTKGQLVAVCYIAPATPGNILLNTFADALPEFPYRALYTGSWAKTPGSGILAFEYDDGRIIAPEGCYAIGDAAGTTITTATFNNGSSPNVYGVRFTAPGPKILSSAWFWIDVDGACDIYVVAEDWDGTQGDALAHCALDPDVRASTAGGLVYAEFDEHVLLEKDVNYRVVVVPSSVTSISLYWFGCANAAQLAGQPMNGMHLTTAASPTNNNSFTNYNNGTDGRRVLMCGLGLTEVGNGTGPLRTGSMFSTPIVRVK